MGKDLCFCPPCYQGDQCEFSLATFGFTLDSLLVNYSNTVKIVCTVIIFLFFAIGLFNNLCSLMTFKRPTTRKFGVGIYLLLVACLNQISLFCLFIKILLLTIEKMDMRSCKAFSYSLSAFTRSANWLTSWITIDRLLIVLFPASSYLKNPRVSIGISTITCIILFSMHIHEILYSTLMDHYSTNFTNSTILANATIPINSATCVMNINTYSISLYNRISTLVHYLVPFLIQIVCITYQIILATRSRSRAVGQRMTFLQVLTKQFRTQKENYITPTIIALSALPQAILTFSFACTEWKDWQRHALLAAYLLSYIPQTLGFLLFVLPSTTYRKEFAETTIAKKIFRGKLRSQNNQ